MRYNKAQNQRIFLLIFLALLIVSEIILRQIYGFTDAVIFKEDKEFEYIPVPQTRLRFGNLIKYNSLSQRNREPTSQDSNVILFFGDSVLNGGVQVNQDSLATEKLTNYLSHTLNEDILIMNISAPSWGPDNGFAYLKKYGDFGAKKILLVVSSHDAFDNMTFEKVIGVNANYPDKQYKLALHELWSRYVFPRLITPFINKPKGDTHETIFNSGFENFKNYADSTNIPLTIYLHPEKTEILGGEYNLEGKKIIEFCQKNSVHIIKGLDHDTHLDSYLDNIHLSEKGHHNLFITLKDYF